MKQEQFGKIMICVNDYKIKFMSISGFETMHIDEIRDGKISLS